MPMGGSLFICLLARCLLLYLLGPGSALSWWRLEWRRERGSTERLRDCFGICCGAPASRGSV